MASASSSLLKSLCYFYVFHGDGYGSEINSSGQDGKMRWSMVLWRWDMDKDVLWVQAVLAEVGKVTTPNLTSHSTSFWCSEQQQKNMERNCLEIYYVLLLFFFPFSTMAMEGPTGHLMSCWCLFSVSEADDSRWLTGMVLFAKFLLESRREANTFSWDGNLSADCDQEASPPLGLYMQPAATRMVAIRFTGKVRPFTLPGGRHSQVFPKHLSSFPSYSLLLDRIGVNTFLSHWCWVLQSRLHQSMCSDDF